TGWIRSPAPTPPVSSMDSKKARKAAANKPLPLGCCPNRIGGRLLRSWYSWYRRGGCASKKKGGEAHLMAADGRFRPVRSSKGGFTASLLMSRPPLLFEEGSWATPL